MHQVRLNPVIRRRATATSPPASFRPTTTGRLDDAFTGRLDDAFTLWRRDKGEPHY